MKRVEMQEVENQETKIGDSKILPVNTEGQQYLFKAATWAQLLSYIGFAFAVFFIALGLFYNTFLEMLEDRAVRLPVATNLQTGLFITGLLYFFPSMFLYDFAYNLKQSIAYNSEAQLVRAFLKLKSFFKFWGIIGLIVLLTYLLSIAFVIAAGINVFNQLQQ